MHSLLYNILWIVWISRAYYRTTYVEKIHNQKIRDQQARNPRQIFLRTSNSFTPHTSLPQSKKKRMAPRYQDNLPLVVSAASVTTALLTYFVTKKVVTSKLQQQVRDFEESKKRTSIVSADFAKVEKEDDSDDVPTMGVKIPDA